MSVCLGFCKDLRTLLVACAWRGLLLLLVTCLLAQNGWSQAGQSSGGQDSNRFEVQANRMMELYDKNKNGFLSRSEVSKMPTPLKEPRFDLNGDSRLSQKEIVAAISRRSSGKPEDKRLLEVERRVKAMLQRFDKNSNGFIDKKELANIPDKEKWIDSNGDQRISFMEMSQVLAKTLKADESRLSEIVPKQSSDALNDENNEIKQTYLRFLDAAMKKNDLDQNGQLDAEEIAKGRWSEPIKNFDADGDGVLTRGEMLKRYEKMFNVELAEADAANMAKVKLAAKSEATETFKKQKKPIGGIGDLAADGKIIGGLVEMKEGEALGGAMGNLLGFSGVSKPKPRQERAKSENPADSSEAKSEVTFFFLQHRTGVELVKILEDIFDAKRATTKEAQQMMMLNQLSGRSSRSSQSSRSGKADTFNPKLRFGADEAFNAVYAVGATASQLEEINEIINLLDRKTINSTDDTKKKKTAPSNSAVIQVFLLCVPPSASSQLISEAVTALENESIEDVAAEVAIMAKNLGIKKYDHVNLKAAKGARTEFQNDLIKPSSDQRTRTQDQSHFSGQLVAIESGDVTKLEFSLSKTDLLDSETAEQETAQVSFELSTTVVVENGKPTVLTSKSSNLNWILVTTVQ